MLRFVLAGMVAGPVLSATLFAAFMHLTSPNRAFWTLLQVRADSDMLGYAMFTPLVLVLSSRENYRRLRKLRLREWAVSLALFLLVGATDWIVFAQSSYALDFLLVALILLINLRLGFAASVLAVNLLSFLATSASVHGHGPLTLGYGSNLDQRILLLQAFLALAMITAFSVSVVQLEREVAQSRLETAYREMERLATTDPLTGLPNRRLFEDHMRYEWARAAETGDSVALLMIDVDHFKSYNDRYGHQAGDAALCAIALAIQQMDHRSGDLLARYGGEELIFLLPAAKVADAMQFAEAIRSRIEGLHLNPGSHCLCRVTVSVGCAALEPRPGFFPELLVGAADEALYRAKRNGRNRVEITERVEAPFRIDSILETRA